MPRKYRHIKDIEKEILKYIVEGHTLREAGEKFGFTYQEMRDFKTRYNKNQRKLASGISVQQQGRPIKAGNELPPSIQGLSRSRQLEYKLASKERYIKRLEMENELLRDFLSHAGKE